MTLRAGRREAGLRVWDASGARAREAERRARASARRRGASSLVLALVVSGVWSLASRPPWLAVAAFALAVTGVLLLVAPARSSRLLARLAGVASSIAALFGALVLRATHLLLVVPLGLALRGGSRERLGRRPDPAQPSYWRERAERTSDHRRQH